MVVKNMSIYPMQKKMSKMKLFFQSTTIFLMIFINGCFPPGTEEYEKGIESYNSQKYLSAVEYFTRALNDDSLNAEYYFQRGNSYVTLGDIENAFSDFNKAIFLDSTDSRFVLNRGQLYSDLEDYSLALKDFHVAQALQPENPWVYFNLGYCSYLSGNLNDAIDFYSEAIKLDSVFIKAYVNRGNVYSDLKEPEKAISDFTFAIELNPDDEIAFTNRASEYFDTGEFQNAINDLDEAIKLNGNNSKYYYSRAEAKINLGNFLGAAADYTNLISLDSTDAMAYYNRGICYANIDLRDNACEDVKAGELGFFQAYEVINKYCGKKKKKK
jgi:tetratricopeptide (TPR) repeat protein